MMAQASSRLRRAPLLDTALPQSAGTIEPADARREQQPSRPQHGNVVKAMFQRFGNLDPIVARRMATAPKIDGLIELKPTLEDRARAIDRDSNLPTLDALTGDLGLIDTAIFDRASESDLRVLIATMLEAMPAAQSQATPTYIDALVWWLEHIDDDRKPEDFPKFSGLSGHVVTSTIRSIWATSTFAPSIEQVLKAVQDTRARYWHARCVTTRLITLRRNVEAVLDATDGHRGDDDDIPF